MLIAAIQKKKIYRLANIRQVCISCVVVFFWSCLYIAGFHVVVYQEGDMSAEMYNFHEAIDELQRSEEEVLDNHKAISDYLQHSLLRCNQLLSITRDVDYDQDGEPLCVTLYNISRPKKMVLRTVLKYSIKRRRFVFKS